MLRHVVLLKWTEEATADQVDAVIDGLTDLPSCIPQIRSYAVGTDEGLREGNFDLAIVAEFENEAGWREYGAHPDHLAVIEDRLRPILAHRASVQYAVDQRNRG